MKKFYFILIIISLIFSQSFFAHENEENFVTLQEKGELKSIRKDVGEVVEKNVQSLENNAISVDVCKDVKDSLSDQDNGVVPMWQELILEDTENINSKETAKNLTDEVVKKQWRDQKLPEKEVYSNGEILIHEVKGAVNLGLQASESLKLQEQKALLAMKVSKLAFKDFLPTLTFNWSESDSIKFHSSDSRTKNIQMGFDMPIFNGGKSKITYDMGKLSSFYDFQNYQLEEKAFRSRIVSAYYNLLTARSASETKRQLLENAEEQLKITEAEYKLGLVLETDYIDYLISVMGIRNDLKQSERTARTLLREFKILIGLPLEAELIFTEKGIPDVKEEFMIEPYSDLIWQIVEQTNLELKQENISIEYNRKQIKMNEKFFVPTFTLGGGHHSQVPIILLHNQHLL